MRISDWSSDVCSSDLELAKVRIENRAKTDVLADRGDRLQRARTVRHHGEQLGDVGELAGFDDVVPHADLVGGHVRTVDAGDAGVFSILGHRALSLFSGCWRRAAAAGATTAPVRRRIGP